MIVARGVVKRKRGNLYYVDADGNVHEKLMKQYRNSRHTSRSIDGVPKKRKKATKKKPAKRKKK